MIRGPLMSIRSILVALALTLGIIGNADTQELSYKTGLEGPATAVVEQYLERTELDCDTAEKVDDKCTIASVATGAKLFHGTMPGDAAQYAVAFVNYELPGGGNSTYLMAIVFKSNSTGAFVPLGRAEGIYGTDPRDLRFGRGAITYTGSVLGPRDARCCPTASETFTLRLSGSGVTFVDRNKRSDSADAGAAQSNSRAAGPRCPDEAGLRSTEGVVSTSITFMNRMPIAVRIYWINYDGKRQFYGIVGPHRSFHQQTYVTHPWVLTDQNENCVAAYMPTHEPGRVFVTGERAAAPSAAPSKADGADTVQPGGKTARSKAAEVSAPLPSPAAVRSKAADYLIAEQIAEACDGKKGRIDPRAVIERDLTGDGNADLIISHDGITCGASGRSGACGMQVCLVKIYVRRGPLLKLAVDDLLGTMVTVSDGKVPTIRWHGHGGARRSMKWNGQDFR